MPQSPRSSISRLPRLGAWLRQRAPRLWSGLLIGSLVGPTASFPLARSARADDGAGIQARVGHIEGQGIPQVRPVTPIELFPYIEEDGGLLFGDGRFVITNDGTFAGNLGVGYRWLAPEVGRIFGGSLWYDLDDTRSLMFQQVGLGLETYGTDWDLRGNAYLPVGPESRQDSLQLLPGSLRYQGQNLAYSQSRGFYTAMTGFDAEFGIPVPGSLAESIDLRVYGGGYYYTNDYHNIPGASARMRASLVPGIDVEVQVTHDSFFETRAFAGLSWTFGPLHYSNYPAGELAGRLGEHVTRNYTVVATHQRLIENLLARNPTTNSVYRFAHISSTGGAGGDGTVDNPFASIAAAQGTGADYLLVQSGSVLDGAAGQVALNPGERLWGLGGGLQQVLTVPELGTFALPTGPGSGALPILRNATGDAVVLANNSEFNGFRVETPSGRGVFGNGVTGARVSNVSIAGAGSQGFELENATGRVDVSNLLVQSSGGSGIKVTGTGGTTQFLGQTQVIQPGGAGVTLAHLGAGSTVSFDNLSISERAGRGLEAIDVAGAVRVGGTLTVSNSNLVGDSAIDLRDSSGTFDFQTVNVTDARGAAGINLENNTGTTTIQTVNVTSDGATALRARSAGKLRINPAVTQGVNLDQGGSLTAANATALDIEGTELEANLTRVSSTNAATGVRVVNSPGSLVVWGNDSPGSAGRIENATVGILAENTGIVAVNWIDLASNGTALQATDVEQVVVGNSRITNSSVLGIGLVDVQAFQLSDSTLSGNAGGGVRGEFTEQMAYSYVLRQNSFQSTTGDSVFLAASVLVWGPASTCRLSRTASPARWREPREWRSPGAAPWRARSNGTPSISPGATTADWSFRTAGRGRRTWQSPATASNWRVGLARRSISSPPRRPRSLS
ncbi:MAG: inverse autotransporter beta domain-containing protein [Planctomycetaceae bacterium]